MRKKVKSEEEILAQKKYRRKVLKNLLYLIIKILIVLGIFFAIFTYMFGIIRMRSEVMMPSIRDGDLIIYYRIDKDYKAGEVVVAKIDNKKYVLRIAAVPGDSVDIDEEEGRLTINGAPEEHIAYYRTIKSPDVEVEYPYRLAEDDYFLINDYRSYTKDSREFLGIHKNQILGKVIGKLQTRNI